MKDKWGLGEVMSRIRKKLCAAWADMWSPVTFVGNPNRARKSGEKDGDEEKLGDLNKTWCRMLREDPWRMKLMTHVSLLINISGALFLLFFISGLYLPAKHWIFTVVLVGNMATIPYWIWVAIWHRKIQERVFAAFKKKFGKHFHLK